MKTSGKTSKSTGKAAGRPRGKTDQFKKKDVMTSHPSQDRRTFTSKRNPTGTDSNRAADSRDESLKRSGPRKTGSRK
jgi:hypothetical protein